MGFTFAETMAGTFELDAEPGVKRPFKFEVTAHAESTRQHFNDGKAVEQNFNTYKMPRIIDTPEIEVHIMDNEEKAGGVGEPSLPPFAPALTNAIFDLTGKRVRKLPFSLDAV